MVGTIVVVVEAFMVLVLVLCGVSGECGSKKNDAATFTNLKKIQTPHNTNTMTSAHRTNQSPTRTIEPIIEHTDWR